MNPRRLVASLLLTGVLPFLAHAQPVVQYDIPYTTDPAETNPSLLSLDVYAPSGAHDLPVVVWVHGGIWALGDKAEVFYKADWLTSHDYVFVSVNYRLSPDPPEPNNPDRLRHPTHAQDVAAAVAYAHQQVRSWGGDPNRMVLMGHSAGGHLVSLISTDARYLQAHGMTPTDFVATISLDSGAYDVALLMEDPPFPRYYRNAFSDDPAVWADASPILYVTPEAPIPPFLLVHRTDSQPSTDTNAFAAALQEAGHSPQTYPAPGMTHADINRWLGGPENPTYNADVLSFIEQVTASTTTSEAQPEQEAPFVVAPNPTRDMITFSLNTPGKVYLVDMLGRTVAKKTGNGTMQLDLRPHPPGVYTLVVVRQGQRNLQHVVRLR